MWPILPMKRPMVTGWPGFGIIHAARLLTVWQVSMFDKIEPETTEKIEYKSIDAMLADGWVVD